jgi:hypothetical protein
MSVHTPQFAPIVVLAFLGTVGVLILCAFTVLVGAFRKSSSTVLGGIGAGAIILVGYASILFGLSLLSRDVEIVPGAWKYFCELDCHLAYAIGGTYVVTSVGPEMQSVSANGRFAIVQIKTWFDPATISPQRGDGPLTPNGRAITLVDDRGRKFAPSAKGDPVLAAARLHSTPLRSPLRPGESYVSYLVFEIPEDARGLKLLLTSSDAEGVLIWGDENSPLHRKAYFALPRT